MRGAAVHEAVGDDGGRVADGDAHRILRPLQDEWVRLVVAHQQLQVEVDGLVPGEDRGELLDALLPLLVLLREVLQLLGRLLAVLLLLDALLLILLEPSKYDISKCFTQFAICLIVLP